MIKRLLLEAVFATIVVFGIMGLFAIIPLNIGALRPLDAAVEDFDMMDLYYSQLKGSEGHFSKEVILVNIGDAGRAEIAELIDIIAIGEPSGIGVDVFFADFRGDMADSLLAKAISENPNVVMACSYNPEDETLVTSTQNFQSSHLGYANFVAKSSGLSTIRQFLPQVKIVNTQYQAFGVQLAKLANPEATAHFLKHSSDIEEIKYFGNTESFLYFEKDQILSLEVDPEVFAGKVVLLGFLGKTMNDASTVEDKFFTPLNEQISGRSLPDMSGLVIHANIIEMILTKNGINRMSQKVKVLFSILITYIHVVFYMFLILKWALYFDALSKILQAISILLMIYLVFLVFHHHNFRLDITLGLIGVVLAADVLFVYEAIANTVYRRWGWKSILIQEE